MIRSSGALRVVLAVSLFFASWAGGCSREAPPVPMAPGQDRGDGFGEALFRSAGLSGWYPEDDPDVGEGLEGLYALVNGAADSYWERGVTRAVFQGFRPAEGNRILLEVQHYVFREAAEARAFFENLCRQEDGVEAAREHTAHCLFSTDPANRAILRGGPDLVDLRLYGKPDSDPIVSLVEAFHRMAPLPAGRR